MMNKIMFILFLIIPPFLLEKERRGMYLTLPKITWLCTQILQLHGAAVWCFPNFTGNTWQIGLIFSTIIAQSCCHVKTCNTSYGYPFLKYFEYIYQRKVLIFHSSELKYLTSMGSTLCSTLFSKHWWVQTLSTPRHGPRWTPTPWVNRYSSLAGPWAKQHPQALVLNCY